jgi:hypothetical protein
MAIILPLGIASAHVFPVQSEDAFARCAGVAEMAAKRVTPQQSMHVNQKVVARLRLPSREARQIDSQRHVNSVAQ